MENTLFKTARLTTILIWLLFPGANVIAEEIPTNKELYEMLLKTQKKVDDLEKRAIKAEAEADNAKKELGNFCISP